MKAIIAAGGEATRVRPAQDKSQQIVYDKPVLYYLLTNVMKAGIREVIVVCNERNVAAAETLFRDSEWEFGVTVKFATIATPNGPAGVFRIPQVKRFVGDSPVCLMLDGIYHGGNFDAVVSDCGANVKTGATILAKETDDPSPFGWIKTDESGRVFDIEEKPDIRPVFGKSFLVQTHMYFYGPEVVELACHLQPSRRGEFEVTDLHKLFLNRGALEIKTIHDKNTKERLIWDDAGTAAKLLNLAVKIRILQEDGFRDLVGSPHLQALKNGWVTGQQIAEICGPFMNRRIEYYDALLDATSRAQHNGAILTGTGV